MKVLFICKSNFGRSQIAESIFNLISKKDVATSAAIEKGRVTGHLLKDFPEHGNLLVCMDEIGIDLRENVAEPLTPERVQNADQIIVMAEKETWPDYLRESDKTIHWKIDDPCGQSLTEFRRVRDQIEKLVKDVVREMNSER